jgi:predicted DNA binding CopG/RHH family protein
MARVKRKRINMRIPEDLVDFIKKHAEANGVTMTDDYVTYLTTKKAISEKETKDEPRT